MCQKFQNQSISYVDFHSDKEETSWHLQEIFRQIKLVSKVKRVQKFLRFSSFLVETSGLTKSIKLNDGKRSKLKTELRVL